MTKKKLAVAFLWHMHQPLYKDLVTGVYHLPWVRLHSTYSYLDMASILDDFSSVKVTFNLTPSLIWQILDIAKGGNVKDKFLELSERNARDLIDKEKAFILKNFFSCDFEKAIKPFKKYGELFSRRGSDLKEDELIKKSKNFSVDDFRDLQVFFNLAWCGFTLREKDKLVKALVHKASGFAEDEKHSLLKRQHEVVAEILPAYKRLQDEGKIEISTSPFYHPILPLLMPGASGPGADFTVDAKVQLERAVSLYKDVFGKAPRGMWPSEGSVSQEIIPLLADAGIKWIATDEGILLESFRASGIPRDRLIYRAYEASEKDKSVSMVFRDVNISNAVSFKYAHMPTKKACDEMLSDIRGIREAVGEREGKYIVPIILDGENPWPYYASGGKEFLHEMYKNISADKNLELVTIGGYVSSREPKGKIDNLYAGSWIDRNFNKWIGAPQKNKAWKYLDEARKSLAVSAAVSKEVMEELYIAEGSDWFWWYDDFGTELNFVFDELFRMHLANTYTLRGRKPPHYLLEPIPSGPSARKLSEASPSEMASFPKVLMVASEVVPFAKTGGLADVAGSLSKELASLGCDVRVIMPLYKSVSHEKFSLKHIPDTELSETRSDGVTYYFIENKKYFLREELYGTPSGDYPDNGIRFGFFSKAVLDAIKAIDFKPDIIHCNDWQSALIPFYLKYSLGGDGFYNGIKTLFTIHNMAYQGVFDRRVMPKIGIPDEFFDMNHLEFYGKVNFMKSGILYSNAISTVSHKYAEEIMTADYGCGLDGLLRVKMDSLYGIPNGVDYSVWNPRIDNHIRSNYDASSVEKKKECKKDLLEYTSLKLPLDAPLFGCVTRFAEQKGIDLIAGITDKIVDMGGALVMLGSGSDEYMKLFSDIAAKYPKNVYVCEGFNDELAHKIEAGCDIFLMPSRYEPCGLNQMYSIKYGTIPVVRATGGLDDVIIDFDVDREKGNGFKFGPADTANFLDAVNRAVVCYKDKALWKKLMVHAMSADFSWTRSAKQYLQLYRKVRS